MPRAPRLRALAIALLAGPLLPPSAAAAPSQTPPSAARYGPEPVIALSPPEAQALDLARARFSANGARPAASGALVAAARLLAEDAAGGGDPTRRSAVRDALARALAYDPAPTVFAARGPAAALQAALERALRPGIGSATHVGAGVVERDGTLFTMVLVSSRGARLDPFPQRLAAATRAVLSGQLRPGLTDARVFVTPPSGRVLEIRAGRGVRFRVTVPLDEPGRHVVEVLATGPQGPTVAALFPVVAGEGAIEEPAADASAAPSDPDDPEAVLEALQALRRRRGLSRLVADPKLSELARRHSAAMRASGTLGHAVAGSPGPEARLRAARVPYRRLFENVAAARTALEAHEVAAASPAHLRNMLEPGIRKVGIGVAREDAPPGQARVYLTEIFLE